MFGRIRQIIRALRRDPDVRLAMQQLAAELVDSALDALSKTDEGPAPPAHAQPQAAPPAPAQPQAHQRR